MQFPVTDKERTYGTIMLLVLPDQAEQIAAWLETRGLTLSPAARLDPDQEPVRVITLTDEVARALAIDADGR